MQSKSSEAVLAGWFSIVVSLGQPIIVLPIALIFMTTGELAVWLFLNSLLAFGILADVGFTPNLTRAFSVANNSERKFNVSAVYRATYLVSIPIVIVGITITGLGALYFLPNLFRHTDISDSLNKITVVALVATTFIQLISLRFIAELNGTGFIHISKLIDALTATLRIIGCAFVITFGGSYWAVAIVFLLVQLVQLVLLYISSRARRAKLEQPSSLKPVFNYIAPVTWRTAGVNTGTFFILYGANFFATLLEDVEEATSLMLSIRIALVLKQVAVMPMQIVTPKLALFFTRQQYKQATDIFIAAASIGMLTFILGSGVILLLGDEIISAISNNSLLLNKSLLGFLLFIFFLEVNHSLHGTFYVQSNHVPFLWASVISAISYLLLGYFFMADFGILGILCSLFISQLVVNNWLPLLYSRRLLSASLITVYIKIFKSWFVPGPFILLKKL